ncbi:MAG: hypothetical protein ACRDMV_05410 [Streptosporangiales bacterium]
MPIRRVFIDGGVSYHHGLSVPGEAFADFDRVDLMALAEVPLESYDLAVVPRSADGEVLHSRRYQFARFLDAGGVLVVLGEQPTAWFPGSRWQPESDDDIGEPSVLQDHPILGGLGAADLEWHSRKRSWCCHGHFQAPQGADVLVANQGGDAWLYVDRVSSGGVIVAASNLDADTHVFHGSTVARGFLDRLLAWAEEEAGRARTERQSRIAGLYSGVHFQRSFYTDPDFADDFAIVPAAELGGLPLDQYAALWVPRESNQNVLVRARDRLAEYVAGGGTIVCFEEANQDWLPFARWQWRRVDVSTLTMASHPLLEGLTREDVSWHGHGFYTPAPDADVLISDGDGGAVLYVDERSSAGRVMAGTLDPDCHAGYGSGRTRPLLQRIIDWTLKPARQDAVLSS